MREKERGKERTREKKTRDKNKSLRERGRELEREGKKIKVRRRDRGETGVKERELRKLERKRFRSERTF